MVSNYFFMLNGNFTLKPRMIDVPNLSSIYTVQLIFCKKNYVVASKASCSRFGFPFDLFEEKKRKKKKKKGGRKKLESLISYQERLVKEKGLPPSRLMLQHAAAVQSSPLHEFQCDQCDFTSTSKRGLSNHKSHKHKNSEKPEILRDLELNQSLNFSHASEEREELSSVNADMEEPDVEEIENMREVLEETNKCLFCGFKAPVPWVHPSKGSNLSGMDIWDHVWANHPTESEWFA